MSKQLARRPGIILLKLLFAGWFGILLPGCTQVRLPRIDPTGQRIFLPAPNSTTLAPLPGTNPVPGVLQNAPVAAAPAFTQPAPVAPCNTCSNGRLIGRGHHQSPLLLPHHQNEHLRGPQGSIMMTPSRIIAPVGSEVVVMAGLCGDNGYFIKNQPLEWMLSGDSVGRFIEVGGTDHQYFNQLIKPSAKKIDGEYAWGRTSLKPRLITRGNNTPVDDLHVREGQTWLSVSSESAGTSYITCVAPKTKAWDRRKGSTVIHWVDASWAIPTPMFATAGQVAPLNAVVTRTSDGTGIKDWKVRYQIVGGAPAEFLPDGAQQAVVTTNDTGQAPVRLRQKDGQVAAGQTQVRVDIIRPALYGDRELVIESGLTSVTWSSPALTIRAIGPREAAVDEPFAYRLEISNPGDQLARGVVVRTKQFSQDVKYISSDPKPSVYGNSYEWQLGDMPAGGPPKVIDIQLKSDQRGTSNLCFEVESTQDSLKTEACAQTRIAGPCLAMKLSGPATARVGDQATFNIDLLNECDFPLEELQVQITYAAGLNAIGVVENPIRQTFPGALQFGETKSLPIVFQMTQPGIQCFDVFVTTKGGHTSRGRKCIEVANNNQAKLDVQVESNQVVAIGNSIQTRTTIRNTGASVLSNVNVINKYSNSLTLRKVSDGFRTEFSGDDFIVQVGTLNPNQTVTYVMEFEPNQVDGNGFVSATALSAENVNGSQRTNIRIDPQNSGDVIGIPNNPANPVQGAPNAGAGRTLGVTVRALDTAVRRNTNARFQVTVTNLKTTPDENVEISLLVPPGFRFESANPIQVRGQNPNEVYFVPQRSIRGSESITFNVVVRALEIGRPAIEVRARSRYSSQASGTDSIDVNN